MAGCTTGLNDNNIATIGGPEVRSLMTDAAKPGRSRSLVLVDPRSPEDFDQAHLPGAINLGPIQHGERPQREILRARTVVVYGRDPGDALARGMTKRLMESGASGVRLFSGGLREWVLRGWELSPPGANPFPDIDPGQAPIEAVSMPGPPKPTPQPARDTAPHPSSSRGRDW